MDIIYKKADTPQEFEAGKELFLQYANSLNFDLCFQGFTEELETIAIQYNKPKGALFLACDGKTAVGCAGIRAFDKETAELKRMYVKPEYRGCHIGQRLLELSVEIAKELNYCRIRLDTLPGMIQAQKLYHAFGFYEIPSYRFNPDKGTVYMEKILIQHH
jgi:ribosomal protein S18 acetylase RimI-like enzyme